MAFDRHSSNYKRGNSDWSGREGRRSEGPGGSERPQASDRVMHDAVCAECGESFQVPFEPDAGRRIYCRACLKKRDAQQPGERRTPFRHRSEGRDHAPRESFEIVCSHCGKKDTAPFRPEPGSIVLCHDCMADPNVERVGSRVNHKIICSVCGQKDVVPFCPEPGSRVLCHNCIQAEREEKQRRREHFEKSAQKNGAMTVHVEIRCEQCGVIDVLPFVPKTSGKILCRQCAEKLFGEDWARRNCVGAREYPFTCARCAAQGFVPFKPKEGEELFCNHCLDNQAVLGKGRGKRFDGGICIRHSGKAASGDAGSAEGKES